MFAPSSIFWLKRWTMSCPPFGVESILSLRIFCNPSGHGSNEWWWGLTLRIMGISLQVLQIKSLKVFFSDRLEGLLQQAKKVQRALRVQVNDLLSSLRVTLFSSTASLLQASQIRTLVAKVWDPETWDGLLIFILTELSKPMNIYLVSFATLQPMPSDESWLEPFLFPIMSLVENSRH